MTFRMPASASMMPANSTQPAPSSPAGAWPGRLRPLETHSVLVDMARCSQAAAALPRAWASIWGRVQPCVRRGEDHPLRTMRPRPRAAMVVDVMTPSPAPAHDTLVFIPAWNEEASLPGVLAEAGATLPEADLLVIDDGSTDGTAGAARAGGADVVSFPENRGLREGIAEGYRQALVRGYAYCGRLDADGQHPAEELAQMLELVRSGHCDVAVGSRFLPGSGKDGERYKPPPERVFGTSLLRLLMRLRLGQPISGRPSGPDAGHPGAPAPLA